ncbi:restriction endonuclease [Tokyovirus A1]|uniref:restriction endonuclease n=1 Tax=Tokyovirus A1 TaxID=1826170 RepID=UPI0007A979A8|nr:restriction endonuclease [Tokyovirus A1]BAU80263.1 restriction endonuclease [Tokyovirus A1]
MNCETRTRGKLCGREECKPCFERSFASCDKAKYLAEGQENPLLIAKNSHKKFSFICGECGHSFESNLGNISCSGQFCPYCSNWKLCCSDECDICFKKSFASHKNSAFWCVDKNKKRAREVRANSNKKFWFECEKCKHSFEASLSHVSKGTFCPFCSSKKLCSSDECKTCFEKSFASSDKAKFWSVEKNKQSPREVFENSNKKFWFECRKCKHSFEMRLYDVSKGKFCPFCSKQKLCSFYDCGSCFGNSFASHQKIVFWCAKNKKSPREVFKNSAKKYFFRCEKRHEFSSALSNVSYGYWCPVCKNKTETKLFPFFEEHFEDPIHQFKVSWCKNPEKNTFLPFDFCVSKTIIELDGRQHYEQVSNWKSPEEQQKSDRYKEEQAIKNGYSVLRILQEDVWKDKIDWKSLLLEHVKDYETPIVKNLWEVIEEQQE